MRAVDRPMLDRRRAVQTSTPDGVVWLLKSFDAMIAERDGKFERVPWHRTSSHLRGFRAVDIRDLLSDWGNRTLGLRWPIWDSHIIGLAARKLRDGELVMLVERRSAAPEPEARDREGALARFIDRALRGAPLVVDGTRFRVVAGYALDAMPGRDDYQVVRRAEADALLEKAAAAVPDPALRDALTQARSMLARDELQARKRDGVLLVRHQPARMSTWSAESTPLTPAQLKAAIAKDWIELEIESADGSPFEGRVQLEFADGRVETTTVSDGVLRFDHLVPGSVRVTLPDVDGAGWRPG